MGERERREKGGGVTDRKRERVSKLICSREGVREKKGVGGGRGDLRLRGKGTKKESEVEEAGERGEEPKGDRERRTGSERMKASEKGRGMIIF